MTDISTEPSGRAPGARLIYGCMGLGGGWDRAPYTTEDVDRAQAAVAAALECGITVFDLADIYRFGKSESVFGEVLARTPGLRERITVQTKCGIRLAEGDRPGWYDLRADSIVRRVEESLARLRTDVIDTLLLHRPDPLTGPDEIAAALHKLHRQGLVRRFGVSNMSGAQIAHLQARLELPLVANQLEMSLDRRDWVEAGVLLNTSAAASGGFPEGTLEACVDRGIQLQAWGALARGRYTGDADNPAARLLRRLARSKDTTPETVLLWWLARHPAGLVPVIGTSRPERIRACRDAALRAPDLTHEEWYELWIAARGAPLP
ncbi:aldo/keto reductase [Streptomyces hygroscopicus subsp. hygroscopicus]|uniref:aldo/keto reductase n=1 Tax=Streptomyces sp. KHY 26 TaxID=3097359 RepID=UPI0024A510C3|nr:aldo/keto reductase [Streptomyces hygroscopicus]GLX50751.1 aldo/keto reductase [Streptomyces hygroscopicus subsp. hygroscopicus]